MTKQEFALRLLEAMIGLEYMKRLQKMIGVPLPERVIETMAALPSIAAPPGVFSAVSPLFVTVWEGGPIHITQAKEGEIIMPTIRRAEIDFTGTADEEIVAAVNGARIAITNLTFTVGGETNITLKSGSTAISGAMDFGGENEPRGISDHLGDSPLRMSEDEAFVMASSIDVQISGYVTYYLDPVD